MFKKCLIIIPLDHYTMLDHHIEARSAVALRYIDPEP